MGAHPNSILKRCYSLLPLQLLVTMGYALHGLMGLRTFCGSQLAEFSVVTSLTLGLRVHGFLPAQGAWNSRYKGRHGSHL